jgi:hypothetical protein
MGFTDGDWRKCHEILNRRCRGGGNEQGLERGDVRYRLVIDMTTLDAPPAEVTAQA